MQKLKQRPSVEHFANAIERSLRRHDARPGWFKCHPLWLLCKLQEEIGELASEMRDMDWPSDLMPWSRWGLTLLQQEKIVRECADAAAVLHMLADVIKGGSLHTSDEATPIVAQWYGEEREWDPGKDFTLPLPGEKSQEPWRSLQDSFNEEIEKDRKSEGEQG